MSAQAVKLTEMATNNTLHGSDIYAWPRRIHQMSLKKEEMKACIAKIKELDPSFLKEKGIPPGPLESKEPEAELAHQEPSDVDVTGADSEMADLNLDAE